MNPLLNPWHTGEPGTVDATGRETCYELPVSAGMGTESKVSGAEVSGGNLVTTGGARF